MFDHQTFPEWTGLNIYHLTISKVGSRIFSSIVKYSEISISQNLFMKRTRLY